MNHLPISIAAALESLINQIISLDPDVQPQLEKLREKVVTIKLTDLNMPITLLFDNQDKMTLMSRYDNEVDATISGSSFALSRMSLSSTPNEYVLKGDVTITGDVETAEKLQALMASLHIDWEEQLSKISGDLVAHKVGKLYRNMADWGRATIDSLSTDATEYVQFEKDWLPIHHEVEEYIQGVDQFRADVDRAEARVNRLLENLPGTSA